MTGLLSGWAALALIPLTAIAGWLFRRLARGRFALRMRPHYVLGYAVLGLALIHLMSYLGGMQGANATGLWLATLATAVLTLQALLGSNLQSPGLYRVSLRRWHLTAFVAALALASLHVAYTAAWSPLSIARDPLRLPLRVAQQSGDLAEITALALHAMHDP